MLDLIKRLNIRVIHADIDYIPITKKRKAKGSFRWNYSDNQAEIVLAKSATDRTLLHEIGHAINFILGKGDRYSDKACMDSENFANMVADVLEICYSKTAKEDNNN
jgi:hypothetical protein